MTALAVLVFAVLVYAVAFGIGLPRLSKLSPGSDRSLLVGGPLSLGGALAAIIAATTMAEFSFRSPWSTANVLVLVAVLAAVIAFELHGAREIIYGLIGVSATSLLVVEATSGACGETLPSTTAVIFALVPAGLLLLASLARGTIPVFGPWLVVKDLGRVAIAVVAVVQLGTFAVFPSGLPLLEIPDGAWSVWLPYVLWLLLAVVAVGAGIHPRAGADITAIGMLVLSIMFGALGAPCGLALTSVLLVAASFVCGLLAAGFLRRLLPGRRR